MPGITIALDIGGTFTDLAAFDEATGKVHQAKSATTPKDIAVGIRETLRKSGLDLGAADSFVHGSTTAINTAIERTGARTALITTRGMRDVYEIARDNRIDAYNLFFKRAAPFTPRHLIFEVDERLDQRGELVTAFNDQQAGEVAAKIATLEVESVAICFLHSYVNPEHEQRMAEIVKKALPGVYVTISSDVLREYREYERTSTTALNSYIGPRVSKYLGDLDDILANGGFKGRLLIMQSNGGVMSPAVAKQLPVAMMESGPVGGVIAAAEVGKALGYSNVIAFDMGGTTAKTSAIRDGVPEIAQGYIIGGRSTGHPVMLPVVDIVEVGTGGGSIAWIDPVGALRVGPKSAGGQPGPIAYGWGGTEPTITDCNALLGRINPARFLGGEMPLDLDGANKGLQDKVSGKLGMNTVETALGVLRIAENAMSLAVREVSVERGYDPRDFVMVAMGGAGPLHGVAVARELHIPTVIIPRLPAHFSAFGMILADLRHDYVRTVFRPIVDLDFAMVQAIFDELIGQGEKVLADEGVTKGAMAFERFVDVRYVGQEFTLQVPVTAQIIAQADREAIRHGYNEMHKLRYGQSAEAEPVEIVNIRVVARGRRERPKFPPIDAGEATNKNAALVGERDIYWEDAGKPVKTKIYNRDLLTPDITIAGPAIIEEYASTTVIHPGDSARAAPSGELIITVAPPKPRDTTGDTKKGAKSKAAKPQVDPITLEVIRNALPAFANEMMSVVQYAAYSPFIYEVKDYCVGIYDVKGRIMGQGEGGVAMFLADIPVVVKDAIRHYGIENIHPGDVLCFNHAKIQGSHPNHINIMTPFFVDGEIVAFPTVKAHHRDIGGNRGGITRDYFEEGIQFDHFKLYERGVPNETGFMFLTSNVRIPEHTIGDLRAQVAACRLAERRMEELFRKFGKATIMDSLETIYDMTEAACRAEVEKIPDGEYRAEAWFDNDRVDLARRIPLHTRVVVKGGDMTIDLTGCSNQVRGNINSRTLAPPFIAYKALTAPTDPVNEGSFRALKVEINEGNIMMATPPAPYRSWSAVLATVIDCTLAALAPAIPDRIPAGGQGVVGGSGLSGTGVHPETGRYYNISDAEGAGWGARPFEDGISAQCSIIQGDVRNAPVEACEHKWPIRVEKRGLRVGSGGPGTFRGGLGLEIIMTSLGDMLIDAGGAGSLARMGRQKFPPQGLWGGHPGLPYQGFTRHPGSTDWKDVTGRTDSVWVSPGFSNMQRSSGGGGWGNPLERDPELVRMDAIDGYIDLTMARDDYGVVLDTESGMVDLDATRTLRAQRNGGSLVPK